MPVSRGFAQVSTRDQWLRSAHDRTALGDVVVELAADPPIEPPGPPLEAVPDVAAGLAFDPWRRLFHGSPAAGRVNRLIWAGRDPGAPPRAADPKPVVTDPPPPGAGLGGFCVVAPERTRLDSPRGLAVDDEGRLFIAEAGAGRVIVVDLLDPDAIRRVKLAAAPLDLACDRGRVFVLLDAAPTLVLMRARSTPKPVAPPSPLPIPGAPRRLALDPNGRVYLLCDAGTVGARVVPWDRPGDGFAVPRASDLEFLPGGVLVVARRPGEDFARFRISAESRDEMGALKAKGYDGQGIVLTPDDRIGFWTDRGFRHAVSARIRYQARGRVTTFRLDGGEYQTEWGRLFLDACIPPGTDVRILAITTDEPPEGPTMPRTPPVDVLDIKLTRPDLSPPLPPLPLAPPTDDDHDAFRPLFRRTTGREIPWSRFAPGDPFETYEAPIDAPPGRFLWITLALRGDTRSTPRVRALRVEYPGHDLMRRLPKCYSADLEAASFLRRFLAMPAGVLTDLEARSSSRRALIDPAGVPEELLPWLAGFLGLVLDERWPAAAKRTLVAEASDLFRLRGTLRGLRRWLAIYLGRDPVILEHFRVRGLGGAIVGDADATKSNSVLGAGFRVGGAVGATSTVVTDPLVSPPDAFETHAHRFSVVVPVPLGSEQLEVVKLVLDQHRPAHTLVDLCTMEKGMRVGVALYAGLTSVVGRSAAFEPLRVDAPLGRRAIVGRPGPDLPADGAGEGT
jgi:phage tail-like protein